MDLLARREYSRQELIAKLKAKFANTRPVSTPAFGRTPICPADASDAAPPVISPEETFELVVHHVEQLANENLQSDERFVESFINGRKQQGKGPLRIRQELEQKQLPSWLIDTHLQEDDEQWQALAAGVYRKKFGSKPVAGFQEKAKRQRFMHYRGFSPQLFKALIN